MKDGNLMCTILDNKNKKHRRKFIYCQLYVFAICIPCTGTIVT